MKCRKVLLAEAGILGGKCEFNVPANLVDT